MMEAEFKLRCCVLSKSKKSFRLLVHEQFDVQTCGLNIIIQILHVFRSTPDPKVAFSCYQYYLDFSKAAPNLLNLRQL
jgi:hypothetical protein